MYYYLFILPIDEYNAPWKMLVFPTAELAQKHLNSSGGDGYIIDPMTLEKFIFKER